MCTRRPKRGVQHCIGTQAAFVYKGSYELHIRKQGGHVPIASPDRPCCRLPNLGSPKKDNLRRPPVRLPPAA